MGFALFAPYGAPANGVMAILQLDTIAARNLVLNNGALRWSAFTPECDVAATAGEVTNNSAQAIAMFLKVITG
jgi:hypothetical protein